MKNLCVGLAATMALTTHGQAELTPIGVEWFESDADMPTATDRFCYQMEESAYHFIDISESGQSLPMVDDGHTMVSLPFVFRYGDLDATNLAVASNGTVYFEDAYLGLSNSCLPGSNSYGIDAFLAPFWDDLDPSSGGEVLFEAQGTSPNQRAIVQWDNVPRYGEGSNGATFQVVLHQNGDIEFQYADVSFGSSFYDGGGDATVGIQGDPTEGLQWSCDESSLVDEMSLTFSCGPGGSLRVFLYGTPETVEQCGTGSFWVDVINTGAEDETFDGLDLRLGGPVEPSLGLWDGPITLSYQESFSLGEVTGRVPCTMPLGSYSAQVVATFEGEVVGESQEAGFDVLD